MSLKEALYYKMKLEKTEEVLYRLMEAVCKPHWERGDSITEAYEEAQDMLMAEYLPEGEYWKIIGKRAKDRADRIKKDEVKQ